MLGDYATPELVAVVRERYATGSVCCPAQYLIYIRNIATGNFGVSYSRNQDVMELVASAYPFALTLAVAVVIVTSVIGLPLGVLAALKQNTLADVASMTIALLGVAAPGFLVALLMIYLTELPAGGWFPGPWALV